jgi:acid stress chaperone HdeB
MRIRTIGFFLFATIAASAPARAQVTIDLAKITCKQALLDTVAPTKSIALWLSGYYNGKRSNTVIDAGALQKNADKVEDYCRLNLDTTVMDAVQAVFGVSK